VVGPVGAGVLSSGVKCHVDNLISAAPVLQQLACQSGNDLYMPHWSASYTPGHQAVSAALHLQPPLVGAPPTGAHEHRY